MLAEAVDAPVGTDHGERDGSGRRLGHRPGAGDPAADAGRARMPGPRRGRDDRAGRIGDGRRHRAGSRRRATHERAIESPTGARRTAIRNTARASPAQAAAAIPTAPPGSGPAPEPPRCWTARSP